MDHELTRVIEKLRRAELPLFKNADFSDLNACEIDGDNALHVVVRWDDVAGARALINAGIEINRTGDLGYTPLHIACMGGNAEMVKLLVDSGADLFGLSEGNPPFTCARLAGHDHLYDLLGPLMDQVQARDPKIWLKARVAQLQREVTRLQAQLERS